MLAFDVAIVGGGPAGTSTALHLVRQQGVTASKIVVLEKARHPREKPCAGAISGWGVEALAAIGVSVGVPHVTMRGLRVFSAGRVGECRAELGVIVRRCEFDAQLWERAREAGVVCRDGEPLLGIERAGSHWTLTTPREKLSARYVAACDGSGSIVRKQLGLREVARKGHLYVCETAPVPGDAVVLGGLCDFDMRPADDGIEGYYWDFPVVIEGRLAVSRGIYHANLTPRSDVKEHLGRALSRRGLALRDVRLKPFSTRPFVPTSPLSLQSLLLVGEAAGIDATTGEGIAQALLAGRIAAIHLARALKLGEGALAEYAPAFRRARVGRHLLQSAWLATRVYGRHGAPWRLLLAGDARAREAGARWYTGRSVGWAGKARLGIALAGRLALAASLGRAPA